MRLSDLAQLLLDAAETGLRLYEWQRRWLDDDSRFRAMLKSRAVGGSFIIALEAILWSLIKPSSLTILLSYSHRQSMELFRKVREHASRLRGRGVRVGGEVYSLDVVSRESRTELVFRNSSRIMCLPNNPDGVRGYRADHVYVDEAAMFQNDLEVKAAVIPVIAGRSGRLSLVSTPKGRRGWFYEAWTSGVFSRHRVHYGDAPHLTAEDLEGLRRSMSHLAWMQEMEMEFLDDANSLFPYEMIMPCLEDYPYYDFPPGALGGPLYVGVDLGRYRDSTVIVGVEKASAGTMRVVLVKELQGVETIRQIEYISGIIEAASPARVLIDKTGMGIPVCEFLERKYASVQGLTLTQRVKEAIILNLYNHVRSARLKIPVDCEPLIRQLNQFQRVTDEAGRTRYEAPPGQHDDYVIALSLAVYAAASPPDSVMLSEVWRW